ncbi:serine palmitoyltransferase 1 [Planococcus citri]|uniref:serine palmitoyltransferase 1 n=1 Tax=Planococcus citri TaxID=170843 RepID=UPI0031F8BB2E
MEYFVGLVITILTLFVFNNFKKRRKNEEESNKDIDFDWTPDPLVDETKLKPNSVPETRSLIVNSKVGKWVEIDGRKMLNFASNNYLGFIENEYIIEEAKRSIFKYGVGSCGPRGFYGTVDVHLDLESRLCKFMNMESAIVYSYGFSTIASAIPAYAKKQDVIFADERVNFAIQRGIEASRSTVFYFKHNDFRHLESLIKSWDDSHQDKKSNSKIRKFLIVEGIYINSGKICPLPEMIEIRKKYQLRIFIDESISFGVLGKTGRGILEHFNIDNDDVDMIMASMEYALGTGGGFCVGSTFIVEHQRLAGLGYCFSASLPPFLAVAARAGIDVLDEEKDLTDRLSNRCNQLHDALSSSPVLKIYFDIESDAASPIKHLFLKEPFQLDSYDKEMSLLNEITFYCNNRQILITTAHYLVDKEYKPPRASIRLTVSVTTNSEDISKLISTLEEAANEIFT